MMPAFERLAQCNMLPISEFATHSKKLSSVIYGEMMDITLVKGRKNDGEIMIRFPRADY